MKNLLTEKQKVQILTGLAVKLYHVKIKNDPSSRDAYLQRENTGQIWRLGIEICQTSQ